MWAPCPYGTEDHDVEVLDEFSELTHKFLTEGVNTKVYAAAAGGSSCHHAQHTDGAKSHVVAHVSWSHSLYSRLPPGRIPPFLCRRHTHAHIHISAYIYIYMYINTYTHTHTRIHTHTYIHRQMLLDPARHLPKTGNRGGESPRTKQKASHPLAKPCVYGLN